MVAPDSLSRRPGRGGSAQRTDAAIDAEGTPVHLHLLGARLGSGVIGRSRLQGEAPAYDDSSLGRSGRTPGT